MDTCPALKHTHRPKDRTPHRPGTTFTSTLDPPTSLIVDTCRFRACSPKRTSKPCPNLGLDLWCRGRCVRFAREVVSRFLLHLQTVPFTTRQVPVYIDRGKGKRSHALLQYTYCITTIPPSPRLYVDTIESGAIPKRARRPKRRDPHPVPPLRRTRGEGDSSTERRTRRTTDDHEPELDHVATHHLHRTDRTQTPLWHEDDFVSGHVQIAI